MNIPLVKPVYQGMLTSRILVAFFCLTSVVYTLSAQNDFRLAFKNLNPAPAALDLAPEVKLARHLAFLDSMKIEGDSMGQLIGNLYLFLDQVKLDEYAKATPYLLIAESIAESSGKKSWIGSSNYHRGYLNTTLGNYPEALEDYLVAAKNCELVADSICLAESYEQISAVYSRLREFEKAQSYLDRALPLIKRLGDDNHLGIAYNNFGTLLYFQKRYEEAISYTRKSIELHQKTGRKISWAKAKHNLANNQRQLGMVDEAIQGFQECVAFNRENNFRNNIIHNYSGLHATFLAIRDYKSAYKYYRKYTELKDSINSEKTEKEIAALTLKYNITEAQLRQEKENTKLVAANSSLRRTLTVLSGIVLVAFFGLITWFKQHRLNKLKRAKSTKNLASLTRLLIEKNSTIMLLRAQKEEIEQKDSNESEEISFDNVFEQTILTNTDWQEFKTFFESKYPDYIFKLRKVYPEITEAEERLFLLIKTGLNSKEIAALLGISNSSVKKSRNRLRKRLELTPEASLEEFVQNFKSLKNLAYQN